jgi:rhamnose transport system ATP-binding protein
METEPSQPIVELIGISKQFGGVQALQQVQLALYPGEVHALVGENGAGKSTLVKMLAGVHVPDEGTIRFAGEPIELRSPAQAQHRGIAVIHQHPTLFPDLDVAENIFMGRHPLNRLGRIDWRQMYNEVDELFASLHVQFSARDPVSSLSVAHQQLVEIVKALSLRAQVLIMDEPTAALSAREIEELFTIVRRLREQRVAILFISHRLEEIFALSDRITIFRDGTHITTAPTAELTPEKVVQQMVGRALDTLFPKETATIGAVVLKVDHLTRNGVFRDVSFEVRHGEILGFAGLVGAGRTEVARVLFGIDRADAGTILINDRAIRIRSPSIAMQHGLAYVPEDRHQHGLILDLAIAPNITLPILRQISNFTLIDQRRERELAIDYSQRLQVRSSGIDQLTQLLSGGNQQKVVLSKWLATNPSILILDEPTRGIDIGAKAEVHRIISHLAAEGMAIILISSELPEILGMADRILVMHEGRVTGLFDRSEADQAKIMFAATGQVDNGYNQYITGGRSHGA